jgi:hypothetical protein
VGGGREERERDMGMEKRERGSERRGGRKTKERILIVLQSTAHVQSGHTYLPLK